MVTWNPDKTRTVGSLHFKRGIRTKKMLLKFSTLRESQTIIARLTEEHSEQRGARTEGSSKLFLRHLHVWWFNDWGYLGHKLLFFRVCPVSSIHVLLDYTLKVVYGPYLGAIWPVLSCALMRGTPESPRRWMDGTRSGLLLGHIGKRSPCLGIFLHRPQTIITKIGTIKCLMMCFRQHSPIMPKFSSKNIKSRQIPSLEMAGRTMTLLLYIVLCLNLLFRVHHR